MFLTTMNVIFSTRVGQVVIYPAIVVLTYLVYLVNYPCFLVIPNGWISAEVALNEAVFVVVLTHG